MYNEKDIERFKSKVDITEECHYWKDFLNHDGYGRIRITKDKVSKKISAHRMAFEIAYGPIPEGKMVCHTYDNPGCVNPEHLYAGTHRDNMNDMVERDRFKINITTAKLTEAQVLEMRESDLPNKYFIEKYNLHRSTICYARNGNTWKHL